MKFYYLGLKSCGTKCVLEVYISAFKSQTQDEILYTGLEFTSGSPKWIFLNLVS